MNNDIFLNMISNCIKTDKSLLSLGIKNQINIKTKANEAQLSKTLNLKKYIAYKNDIFDICYNKNYGVMMKHIYIYNNKILINKYYAYSDEGIQSMYIDKYYNFECQKKYSPKNPRNIPYVFEELYITHDTKTIIY